MTSMLKTLRQPTVPALHTAAKYKAKSDHVRAATCLEARITSSKKAW